MPRDKKPRADREPRVKRKPAKGGDPEAYLRGNASWRVAGVDMDGTWGWSRLAPEHVPLLLRQPRDNKPPDRPLRF